MMRAHRRGRSRACQVGSFRTQSHLSAQEFKPCTNALLPRRFESPSAEEVGPDSIALVGARQNLSLSAVSRKVVSPMVWRYVLHYPFFPLDEDAMGRRGPVCRHTRLRFVAASTGPKIDKERSTERRVYSTELCAPRTTKSWSSRFAGAHSIVIWCARWWPRSMWAAKTQPRTSIVVRTRDRS